MPWNGLATLTGLVLLASGVLAQNSSRADEIEAYIQPYVRSANFAGQVLVAKNGRVIFEKAYGFADREHRANTNARSSSLSFSG